MQEYVEVTLPDGGSLVVESGQDEHGMVPAGRLRNMSEAVAETFESAMIRLRSAAESVVGIMTGLARSPDEVTVQFGVKLATQAGVVIAHTSAEANLTVTLTWKADGGHEPPRIAPVK